MSINVQNFILGPALFYVNVFGAAEPLDSAVTSPNGGIYQPPGGSWLDAGGTNNGVNLEVDTTYTDLECDQLPMNPGARLTALTAQVTTKLAEMTLANINTALNQITAQGQGAGFATLDVVVGAASTQPLYAALIIDGWAPALVTGAPARRRAIVRKTLSKAKVVLGYDKKTQQGLDCTFGAYWISNSVNPIHVVDQQM